MKTYKATVQGNKWPHEVTVGGSNWHVAAARAVTAWEKSYAKSRDTHTLTIKLVRSTV